MFDFGVTTEDFIPFVHFAFMMIFGYAFCTNSRNTALATEVLSDAEDVDPNDLGKKEKKTFKKLQNELQKLKLEVAKFDDQQKRFADNVEKKHPVSTSPSVAQMVKPEDIPAAQNE